MSLTDTVHGAAFCWTIERRDGGGAALTSHGEALTLGGQRYDSAPGMVPGAIRRDSRLEGHSAQVDGALSSEALSEQDLITGRWRGARVRLSLVDWDDPQSAATNLLSGELGHVERSADGFEAELTGAGRKLERPACPVVTPECRAELGDRACRVDMAGRRMMASLDAQNGDRLTLSEGPGDDYLFGEIILLDGLLAGWRSLILGVEGDDIWLADRPPLALEQGVRLWLTQGCDKSFATCRDRFQNAHNFRGEPYVPGADLLMKYPGA